MFYFHVSDIPVCLHNTCCEYPRHLCHMWLEKAENLRHIWDSFDQQIIPLAPEWPVPPAAGWWSGVVVQGFSFTSTILSICNGTCPTCRWLSHSRLGIVQCQIKGGSYQICLVIPPIFHERHSYLSLGSLLLHWVRGVSEEAAPWPRFGGCDPHHFWRGVGSKGWMLLLWDWPTSLDTPQNGHCPIFMWVWINTY